MAEKFELTPEMKKIIGVESPPWNFLVEKTGCHAFARAIGYDDMVYYRTEDAQKEGYRDIPAPPCYLGTPEWIPGRERSAKLDAAERYPCIGNRAEKCYGWRNGI